LDSARVEIYIAQQRKHDAARVHYEEGRFLEALDTCLEDIEDTRCLELANECTLSGLRRLHLVGLSLDAMDTLAIEALLSRAESDLPKTLFSRPEMVEVFIFHSYISMSLSLIKVLARLIPLASIEGPPGTCPAG